MTTLIEDRRSDETTSTVARANSLLDSRLRTGSSPTPERGGRRSKVQEFPSLTLHSTHLARRRSPFGMVRLGLSPRSPSRTNDVE